MQEVTYFIENDTLKFEFSGEIEQGKPEILLQKDINLLQNTPWNENGYTIQPFTSAENFEKIKSGLTDIIKKLIETCGGTTNDKFTLSKYHLYVNDEIHMKLAKSIQYGWNVSEFPIDFEIINKHMSEVLGKKVSTVAKHVNFNNFFLRIVRPNCVKDNNPPHRDVWLDRLRNAVNIYAPICGSTKKSALAIIPGSHLFMESEITRTASGAFINDTQYTVPCVISVKGQIPRMIRPNPKESEMLIFSPYLVHGGGYNLNENETRMSLEIRFWEAN